MSAYSSYDGVPMMTDQHVMTDIPRNEWEYKSWVTGDAGATDRVANTFHVCAAGDMACIALACLTVGTDVEMHPPRIEQHIGIGQASSG